MKYLSQRLKMFRKSDDAANKGTISPTGTANSADEEEKNTAVVQLTELPDDGGVESSLEASNDMEGNESPCRNDDSSVGSVPGPCEAPDVDPRRIFAARPRAGSSTKKMEPLRPEDVELLEFEQGDLIVWRPAPGGSVHVRTRDYIKTKRKAPSLGELYECIKIDILDSEHRLPNMSSRVELPLVDTTNAVEDSNNNNAPKTWHAPDLFVVTLSFPKVAKKKSSNDGPSNTICLYFAMKKETRDILASSSWKQEGQEALDDSSKEESSSTIAAVRLFDEWCRRSHDDPKFQGRFKLIPHVQNIQELGLPAWIARWNGKPLLIRRTGTTGFLYRTAENCMEMEVSFHPFPWAARQAIQYLREKVLHQLLLTLAFVIEGREEAELPETLIGAAQFCFPEAQKALAADSFFNAL